MKIGVNISFNVKDLDKAKFVHHENGKVYVSLTTFFDPSSEPDKYGNHGFVTQSGEKGEKMPILGNTRVFWQEEQSNPAPVKDSAPVEDFTDDIPF